MTEAQDSSRVNAITPVPTVDVLGTHIQSFSRAELLVSLNDGVLFTPNVDIIMKLRRDAAFHELFHRAEFRVCDSQIVMLGARFLGTPIKEKISGSDFFGEYCAYHRDHPEIRIFLLGAGPGVAEEAGRRVNRRVGRDIIIGSHSPSFGFENNAAENEAIIGLINASGASVLAVGLGAPKQERWIMRNRERMPAVRVFMGIGATLDFEAGNVQRAPVWMQRAGLEWSYRLLQEPKRMWKRYLVDDLPFFWLLLKQRLFGPTRH